MFKDILRLLLLAGLALTLALASLAEAQQQPQDHASESLVIGYSIDSLKVERWQTDVDEFQKRANELGASVVVENADGDDNLQFKQARELIALGVKVLVLVPGNTDTAARIVRAAKDKHVPVLSYDRLIHKADLDLFVGYDSFEIGTQQAQTLVERMPKGNYALLGGSPKDDNAVRIHDGQMSVLKPYIDRGDIKIVADNWARNWDPADAYLHIAEAIHRTHGKIDAVLAANDGTAGGVLEALEEHKLAGKVLVSGQDAELAAVLRIIEGTQTMTVYKPLVSEARQAADAAVDMARGVPIKASRSLNNGSKEVPAILLSTVAVTKMNLKQTIIKDGFQTVEIIKAGLPKDKWPEIE